MPLNNILYALILSIIFLLPDSILPLLYDRFNPDFSNGFSASLFCLFFSISFIEKKWIIKSLLILLNILQIIQLSHWLYFGMPISFDNFCQMFKDIDDVALVGKSVFIEFIPALILIFLGITIQIIISHKIKRTTSKIATYSLVSIIILYVIVSLFKGQDSAHLRPTNPSFLNSIRFFFTSVIYEWKTNENKIIYKPYETKKTTVKAKNIILIMGESTNSRFLSLYGYLHNTTPFLQKMKKNKDFSYAKGISSSVATHGSLPLFFNVVREPLNLNLIRNKEFNLIKNAKNQGYKTFCITAQGKKNFIDSGLEFFDSVIEHDVMKSLKNDGIGDDFITDHLKNIQFEDKNFIVIQPWVIHSPYDLFHKQVKNKVDFSITDPSKKSYATALLYFDEWVEKIYHTVKEHCPKDTIIIFVSDHGELLNENGLQGHMTLCSLGADIALFAFASDNHPLIQWMNEKKYISHYDLGVKILDCIGIDLINPNDDGESRFIHSSHFYSNDFKSIKWKNDQGHIIFEDACKPKAND